MACMFLFLVNRGISLSVTYRLDDSLLSNGYWGICPREWSDRSVKPTTHLHPARRLTRGATLAFPHTSSWRGA